MLTEPRWIEMKCTGETTGTEYFGKFRVKPFLSHKERTQAFAMAEGKLLGIQDNLGHKSFVTALSFLQFYIVDAEADWWKKEKGEDLADEEPIYVLAAKVKEIQESLKIKKPEEAKEEEKK